MGKNDGGVCCCGLEGGMARRKSKREMMQMRRGSYGKESAR